MKIIEHKIIGNSVHEYFFDTGESVGFDFQSLWWEYLKDPEDPETYMSGCLVLEDDTIIDYDGCYELPQAVMTCLALHYKLDLLLPF